MRSFSVRNLPTRWAPWDVTRLIGDIFTDKLRMPCPVSTNLCIEFPDPQASTNKASYKFMRTTSLADSKIVPLPAAAPRAVAGVATRQ